MTDSRKLKFEQAVPKQTAASGTTQDLLFTVTWINAADGKTCLTMVGLRELAPRV
jgi:hypothetical protein